MRVKSQNSEKCHFTKLQVWRLWNFNIKNISWNFREINFSLLNQISIENWFHDFFNCKWLSRLGSFVTDMAVQCGNCGNVCTLHTGNYVQCLTYSLIFFQSQNQFSLNWLDLQSNKKSFTHYILPRVQRNFCLFIGLAILEKTGSEWGIIFS